MLLALHRLRLLTRNINQGARKRTLRIHHEVHSSPIPQQYKAIRPSANGLTNSYSRNNSLASLEGHPIHRMYRTIG